MRWQGRRHYKQWIRKSVMSRSTPDSMGDWALPPNAVITAPREPLTWQEQNINAGLRSDYLFLSNCELTEKLDTMFRRVIQDGHISTLIALMHKRPELKKLAEASPLLNYCGDNAKEKLDRLKAVAKLIPEKEVECVFAHSDHVSLRSTLVDYCEQSQLDLKPGTLDIFIRLSYRTEAVRYTKALRKIHKALETRLISDYQNAIAELVTTKLYRDNAIKVVLAYAIMQYNIGQNNEAIYSLIKIQDSVRDDPILLKLLFYGFVRRAHSIRELVENSEPGSPQNMDSLKNYAYQVLRVDNKFIFAYTSNGIVRSNNTSKSLANFL